MAETKKQLSSKSYKTFGVFSDFSLNVLDKLKSQGYFDEIVSQISSGKEAVVFLAKSKEEKVAIKIYRIENCDFNKMYDYLKNDPRYFRLSNQKRRIIFAWAEREYKNMLKAYKTKINMPKPIIQRFNVLIMSYIGNKEAAHKLKELDFTKKELEQLRHNTLEQFQKITDIGMTHGDLSEFNILYHKKEPYFIDFSQSTTKDNPDYKYLHDRDRKIIVDFFDRKLEKFT